jgi:aminoglycoside phosphotransferase (APT) family kinase protein
MYSPEPQPFLKDSDDTPLHNIEAVLKHEFEMEIENLAPLDEKDLGDNSAVFTGEYQGKKIFIKTIDRPGAFPIEVAASELLQKNGVPNPKILAYKNVAASINRSVLIQEAAVGVSVHSIPRDERTPTLYHAMGTMLAKINAIQIDGYGALENHNGTLRGKFATFSEAMQKRQPNFEMLVAKGHITPQEQQTLQRIFEEISNVDLPHASFLHNDFSGKHVFTKDRSISGVIDFGGAMAGDPRRDIAVTQYFLDPNGIPAFNEGYGPLTQDPLILSHTAILAANKLEYRLKKDFKERIPEAIDKLRLALKQVK